MNVDRAQLLPKSGLGVVAPWLVISPSPRYVTRLDLRILDSIKDAGFWRRYLVMSCSNTEVRIPVPEGRAAAEQLDDQALEVREDYLRFEQLAFRIDDVRYYAGRMARMPLANGRLVHAALGALAIAAYQRANPRA